MAKQVTVTNELITAISSGADVLKDVINDCEREIESGEVKVCPILLGIIETKRQQLDIINGWLKRVKGT